MERLSENLYRHTDTCNVYVLRDGNRAALIDFGDGSILEELQALGVDTITDVLLTHHHRDQCQGLHLLNSQETRIHVPETERHLVEQVDRHWLSRQVYNSYENATDRFSLLVATRVDESLRDYARVEAAGFALEVVPTPGHTLGSVSLRAEVDGRRVLFSGDFVYDGGRMWDLATTQYGYNDATGVKAMLLTLPELKRAADEQLLPSHGPVIDDPAETCGSLEERLWRLLELRGQDGPVRDAVETPFVELTPHLIMNVSNQSHNYFLLSKSGKVLMIDAGYPEHTLAPLTLRHTRRPVDFATPILRERYGVRAVDVIMLTHYHDDHVAAIAPIRRRYETEVWAAENFADVLQRPEHYDVPCLWYEPIPVDRVLPLDEAFQWEEYTFRLHALPGHTLYAVAIEFEVDGKRVLATGDQQGHTPELYNYIYKNRFRHHDYADSAALYEDVRPDLVITGHWPPAWPDDELFKSWTKQGETLKALHEELLPFDEVHLGAEHAAAFIRPYQCWLELDEKVTLEAEVRNPLPHEAALTIRFVCPGGWTAEPEEVTVSIPAHEWATVPFEVTPTAEMVRRTRVGIDVTAGDRRLGQVAEALVSVGFQPGPI